MILKGELLEFRHYAGLPCHLVGCTQALLWPAQGPSQYVGAKVPLRAKPRLLLLSSSLPLSLSFFLFCGFSEETGFLFLSVSPLPPPSPFHPFYSHLSKHHTQTLSARRLCLHRPHLPGDPLTLKSITTETLQTRSGSLREIPEKGKRVI